MYLCLLHCTNRVPFRCYYHWPLASRLSHQAPSNFLLTKLLRLMETSPKEKDRINLKISALERNAQQERYLPPPPPQEKRVKSAATSALKRMSGKKPKCAAWGEACSNCGMQNHFAVACKTKLPPPVTNCGPIFVVVVVVVVFFFCLVRLPDSLY